MSAGDPEKERTGDKADLRNRQSHRYRRQIEDSNKRQYILAQKIQLDRSTMLGFSTKEAPTEAHNSSSAETSNTIKGMALTSKV